MIIRRTFDHDEINTVLKHPAIWPRISELGAAPDEFSAPIDNHIYYVVGEHDGAIFALVIYILEGENLDTHVQVIPEFRQHADVFAEGALIWAEKHIQFEKYIAEIPNEFQGVIDFGLKHGFKIVENDGVTTYLEREHGRG